MVYGTTRFDSKLVRLKAKNGTPCFNYLITFRFQTGSIKRTLLESLTEDDFQFRFQTGSIKRGLAESDADIPLRCFDSKLVRLKDDVREYADEDKGKVSIPNWFD